MKFLEKLFSADEGSSLHPSVKQPEREAIIDLLLLAIYIDGHLSLSESNEFDGAADSLGWESSTDISVYMNSATDRARNARLNEESVAELITWVGQRLTSAGSKERALELLNRLLMSDGKTEVEKTFFQQVEAVFTNG
ncbi:MAG: hypothetical protein ACSHYA_01115 [Opitutaceae bacterium]